ncbi:hypothetical protein E2C01_087186 [Portunus trituberculatus]|uniref:Uncharacterized protein n=1 Tax=Portunus trituberculatus TaxID=210409 RepID=A0A5B7JIE2_PORTR|nr:hypothetical protein [Portunus trituberculatus]
MTQMKVRGIQLTAANRLATLATRFSPFLRGSTFSTSASEQSVCGVVEDNGGARWLEQREVGEEGWRLNSFEIIQAMELELNIVSDVKDRQRRQRRCAREFSMRVSSLNLTTLSPRLLVMQMKGKV